MHHVVGAYASVPWTIPTNLLLFAMLAFWARDLWRPLPGAEPSSAELQPA